MKERLSKIKGFTLLELSIVIGIVAVVVAMCSTFIVGYYGNLSSVRAQKEVMNELSTVKSVVNSWVSLHDSNFYTFRSSEEQELDKKRMVANPSSTDAAEMYKTSLLSFEDGKLVSQSNGVETMNVALTAIKDINFSIKEGLITCEAITKDNESYKMSFALFTTTTRTRYSADSKIDVSKVVRVTIEWLQEYCDNRTDLCSGIFVDSDGNLSGEGTGIAASTTASLIYYPETEMLVWTRGFAIQTKSNYTLGSVKTLDYSIVDVKNESTGETEIGVHYKIVMENDSIQEGTITKEGCSLSKPERWSIIHK